MNSHSTLNELTTEKSENKPTTMNWGRFQWNGDQYKNHSTPQEMRAHQAIQNMGSLEKGINVLDIGCGDGKITKFLAKQVFPGRVLAIDSSESMAKKCYQGHSNVINFDIIQADAVYFKLTDRFDLITSFFCIQWINAPSLPTALENIYNHLKEDGKMCVLLPCYDFPHEVIKGVAFSEKWKKYFEGFKERQTFFDDRYYKDILGKIGFDNVETNMIESHHVMSDNEFINYTRQWCGCYNWLKDTELQSNFINDILKKLQEEQHSEEKFDMIQRSLQIIGNKSTLHLYNDAYNADKRTHVM